MTSSLARRVSGLALIILLIVASACNKRGQLSLLPPAMTATVGPGGGNITSEDGRFQLCVPPGALATPTEITITGDGPYRVKRSNSTAPLVFAMPVTIKFAEDASTLNENCAGLYVNDESSTANLEAQTTVYETTGDRLVSAETSSISPASSFELLSAFGVTIGDIDPLDQNTPQTIPVSFVNASSTSLSAEWRVDSPEYDTSHGSPPAFPTDTSMFIPLISPDSFDIVCLPGDPTTGVVIVTIRTAATANGPPAITAICKRAVDCQTTVQPPGVQLPPSSTYVALPNLRKPENVEVVPSNGAQPPGNVMVDVVGEPLVGTGKVIQRVDGVTGQVVSDVQFPDPPGTQFPTVAFDAFQLEPSPNGAAFGALSFSGVSRFVVNLDAAGNPEPLGQFAFGSFPHASLIANDPQLGVVYEAPLGISLLRPDAQTGFFELEDNAVALQADLRSVVSNAAADQFVGLRFNGGLVWIQAPPGGPVTETLILSTPANHGRLRWDPAGGIGAFSDFPQSTVTAFAWDGASPPTILDTANVGQGPVGLGVSGHRIAAAGFNDDTLTRLELDPVTGLFNTIEIVANPFAADGATEPGHVRFITPEAVVVSYNGSGGIGIIPDFYPVP